MDTATKARVIPEAAPDTLRLYDRLQKVTEGEVITYAELTKALGRDVTTEARGNLQSARRMMHRRHSAVFAPVRGVGLRNVGDSIKVKIGSDLTGVRRALRRKGLVLAAVKNFDNLPQDVKADMLTGQAMIGAIASVTRASERKRVLAAVQIAQRRLTFDETLRLFTPKAPNGGASA